MTITEARQWLAFTARYGNATTTYTTEFLDRALQAIGNDFIFRTLCTRSTGDLLLTPGSASLPNFASPAAGTLTGFRPERLVRAYVISPLPPNCPEPLSLNQADYLEIFTAITNNTQAGFPRMIGFETATSGIVGPLPNLAYTLRLSWCPSFTSWTPGTADSQVLSTTLNLPDDYLQMILKTGGRVELQGTDPEMKYAADSWTKYLEVVERIKNLGAGQGGTKISLRSDPRRDTRPRRLLTGWHKG